MHPGKAYIFYRLLYRIYSFRTCVQGGCDSVNIISSYMLEFQSKSLYGDDHERMDLNIQKPVIISIHALSRKAKQSS
jgi:hypothetical protein